MEETNDFKSFIAEEKDAGVRADVFLAGRLPEFTRSRIKLLNTEGAVTVNGECRKAGYSLKAGDRVEVEIPPVVEPGYTAENLPLEIVYQDSELLVINKAQGMVTHPSNTCHSGTLVNALLYHVNDLSGINGVARPGIVHRLDKDTSGLMLVAKTDNAHLSLAKQIAEKSCVREYLGLLEGVLQADKGIIETNIDRDKKDRLKMAAVSAPLGRYAKTEFKTERRFDKYSLVRFRLYTGRTHQIRVHARHIGHPVVGDPVYSNIKTAGLSGQLLHSCYLAVTHPKTGKKLEFKSDLPQIFTNFVAKLD